MRTRFPPSPTGFLHIGALRTALFSYIVARQTNGKFILRIEDTDQERSVPGAVENILRTLHLVGLDPDEGVLLRSGVIVEEGTKGPYVQSNRLELYKKYADELIRSGDAYPCFCTKERLEDMRQNQQAMKQAPMYDRHCASIPKEEAMKRAQQESHVIRMKMPHEKISWDDDIRGLVEFNGADIDDQVLMKSDGFPTYHLAHVVDDHLMAIDIVIRGEEWLSSTPKHLVLFEKLGWKTPRYAHVPLILNKDKTKLSKRQNDVAAEDYIAQGYLPETLLNFLALLGWNPGTTQELFSIQDLIDSFSLDRVQKSGAIFDREKLDWLQGQWVRKIPLQEFSKHIRPIVAKKYPAAASDADFQKKAALIQERVTLFAEATEMLSYYYEDPTVTMDLLANQKQKVTEELVRDILPAIQSVLTKISKEDWSNASIQGTLETLTEEMGLKRGQVLWPLRAALTGLPFSPGAYEVASVLGRQITLKRLETVMKAI